MRSTQNLKKSSSWFWRLLSKSADLSKPQGRFFKILCASQRVRTLSVGRGNLISEGIFNLVRKKINKITITHQPKVKKLMIVILFNLNQIENTFWNYVTYILLTWSIHLNNCKYAFSVAYLEILKRAAFLRVNFV